ncbi:sigma-54-dependent transcriptional regulator [Zavarzinella formosa]|uniref:sigma-54-dependent transcriptional regulator n=1 Tax=Zavarzinella formosa TaxID=360055 RepID=UPI0002EE75DC|nr:sigma-54 dependent transcriptional regulator [Zavarzinella formosa]
MNILLVDDEASLRRTLRTTLEAQGHAVREAATGAAALRQLDEQQADLVFLDLKLGRESGLDLLPKLLEASPGLGIVMMTAHASIGTAVEAMRRGATDYLPKPFTPDELRVAIDRWHTVRSLRGRVARLEEQVRQTVPDVELTTAEPAMETVLKTAFTVADSEASVLLRGENGTGKGVLAREIHARSRRKDHPFVVVHCPSLSAELLESELFGHARGAFTGAVEATEGKVFAANGGTLFLDEIGDLPLGLQPKLLRFIQDREYERVGETKTRTADVRLIAATNRDLEAEVKAGKFREDLLYRLNVIEITMPPLRQRRHDILPLAGHLLKFFARQSGKSMTGFTAEAREVLMKHAWPGNLRELRNAIERGVILSPGGEVGVDQLPPGLGSRKARLEVGGLISLEELEAEHIRRVLGATASLEEAAAVLGIDASTLYRKRKKLEP